MQFPLEGNSLEEKRESLKTNLGNNAAMKTGQKCNTQLSGSCVLYFK
jgi:hypothetical protein